MTIKARFLRITHIFFAILMLIQLLPDKSQKEVCTSSLIVFAIATEAVVIILSFLIKKKESLSLTLDIFGFIYVFLTVWTLATAKFDLLNDLLFPAPGKVIAQFAEDKTVILTNIKSSVGIIIQGFLLAAVAAIPLGLLIGLNARLGNAASYLTKFFSSIPPIVYIPYGIALLPTFRSVSVFVIFLASFWPIFAGTMSGVLNVDKRTVDSAKVLNVKKPAMLTSVILPASLPQIFLGCNQGLSVSFILLTSAEMIGARDGMGYYVKYYSDFGDYTRTITGLIVIGVVVIAVTFLFNRFQQYLLRWRK
ncbi:MAG: ABC transporter permease subunit [Oscillospiraceae bacterium]|nr:ABC transporter permease subunit [Oscillospiraceae bacterium]